MASRRLPAAGALTLEASIIRSPIEGLIRRHGLSACLLAPPLAFIAVLFLVPLGNVIWGSFFTPGFTLAHYERIVSEPLYTSVLWTTLRISIATSIACVVLGYCAAYLIATVSESMRSFLMLLVVVPFFLSTLIRNYIWMALLQRTGVVNKLLMAIGVIDEPLPLMYNETGVIVVMVNMLLPYTIFPIVTSLLAIPRDLYAASASLGGNSARTFVRVTLPLSLPGVVAGALLVFIVSLGFFITPALVGGPRQMMISNLIDFNVRQVLNWPFAFALANALLVGTLVLYFLYSRAVERRMPRNAIL